MSWTDWQPKINNCEVLIWYGNETNLYPMSEWLHPGSIPIGDGLTDEFHQDLPNLEWLIRHLAWLGFQSITVLSTGLFKGLDLLFKDFIPKLSIKFKIGNWWECLSQMISNGIEEVLMIPGFISTNADFRNSLFLHRQRENNASVLSIRGMQFRVGLAEVLDNSSKIKLFKEKPLDKTQLVNSGILIINLQNIPIDEISGLNSGQINVNKNNNPTFDKLTQIHGYIDFTITSSLKFLISKKLLHSIELTGVKGEPWFIDLSLLETWIKLDYNHFIENFSHLYKS